MWPVHHEVVTPHAPATCTTAWCRNAECTRPWVSRSRQPTATHHDGFAVKRSDAQSSGSIRTTTNRISHQGNHAALEREEVPEEGGQPSSGVSE